MTALPNDPAWPHLFTRKSWTVTTCAAQDAAVSPSLLEMRVPRLQLDSDHLVHCHEERHIIRDMRSVSGLGYVPTGHRLRDLFRKMIEEVAVETENWKRGVDTRRCRDDLEFKGRTAPRTANEAALQYLQLVMSAHAEELGGTRNPWLRHYFVGAELLLSPDQANDLRELVRVVQTHYMDEVALDEAADWIASRFVETRDAPETPTDSPEPVEADEGWTIPGDGAGDMPTEDEEGISDDESDTAEAGSDDGGTDLPSPGHDGTDPETDDDDSDAPGRPGDAEGEPTPGTGEPRERRPGPTFLEDPEVTLPELPGETEEARRTREELDAEAAEAEASKIEEMRSAGDVSRHEMLTGKTEFGLLDIHRHTMGRRASKAFGLAWVPRDTGSQVRYPHRLYPTGRVFAVPAPGGSILVDNSGSMSWHQGQMEAAMLKFPRLLAAVYSMHSAHYAGRRTTAKGTYGGFVGKVCIVAAEGRLGELPKRYGEDADPGCLGHTGGNGDADKASLDYMVKHWPRPWVWVSDGKVEAETRANTAACDAIMRRYQVFRVSSIEDAISLLEGKAVRGFTSCYGKEQLIRRGGPFIQEGT